MSESIEKKAKQLLARAGVDAAPVPVERVAEHLGSWPKASV